MMKRKLEIWTFFTFALLALFIVFLIYPLFGILQQSVIDENGRFTLEQFHKFFTNPYYSSTILNSFTVTIAITVSTLILGIPFAYLHQPLVGHSMISKQGMHRVFLCPYMNNKGENRKAYNRVGIIFKFLTNEKSIFVCIFSYHISFLWGIS